MKKLIHTLILSFISIAAFSQTFSPGDIVVGIAGNGATTLSSSAINFTLKEYTPTGTAMGMSVALPANAGAFGATILTVSGTTAEEGQLNLSPDGLYISVAGYSDSFGVAGNVTSITGYNRSVAWIAYNGNYKVYSDAIYSAQNCRGAAFDGCSKFWAAGAGGSNGVMYVNESGSTASVSITPNTSIRAISYFNSPGQLYYSQQQNAPYGIYTIANVGGIPPVSGSNTATLVLESPGNGSAGTKGTPYGFWFNSAMTVCYIADDRAIADSSAGNGGTTQSGGIQKDSLISGVWTYLYTIPVAANAVTTGAAWVIANYATATTPTTLYVITGEASANRLISITDEGKASAYTLLATAPANDLFKGLSFSPSAVATPTQDNNITFGSVTSSTLTAGWTNNGGAGREVFMNTTGTFTAPSGTPGTGNPAYSGSGTQLVYSGTGSSVPITGLTPNTTYYFEVYAYNTTNCTYQYNSATATNNPNNTTTSPAPGLFVSPTTLTFADVVVNNTYELSYTLSGFGLSNNVTITAPSGYGLSTTSGGPYSNSISVTESAGVANATIYVGFTPTSATGFSGNITSVSGIYSQDVAVSGTGESPTLVLSGTTSFGNQLSGTTSFEQTFYVSGTYLTSDVTITAPTGYVVANTACGPFASTATITVTGLGTPQGATLAAAQVYIEFAPAGAGSYASNIVASATGATSENQAVSGTGVTNSSFGTGNLAVMTLGSGCAALSSSGTQGTIMEFNTSGTTTGYQYAIPGSGGSKITFSGSASYDAPLTLSPDSVMLTFGGYNAAVGASSVTSGTQARAIGSLTNSGIYNLITNNTLFYETNCRQGVTDGCNNYWISGNAAAGQGGLAYFGEPNAAAYADNASDSVNARGAFYLNGNIYFSTATSNTQITPGVYGLGSMPYTPQSHTSVINTGTGSSPVGFFFNNANTICYVADDRTTVDSTTGLTVASGGIQKYTLAGVNWVYQYTLPVSANGVAGARWLTVDFGGANPIIYATTGEASAPNRLVKITDAGNASNFTLLSTSGTDYIYRGVAFTPTAVPVATQQDSDIVFSSIVGSSMTVSWKNGNGAEHLVRIDTGNNFTHPKYDSTYTISNAFANTGQQNVYLGTGNSVTITGLTAGTLYWIRVFGVNTRNCTIQYDTVTATNNPLPNATVWTGVTSIDWGTGTNWSTGVVPAGCATNVLIPAGTLNSPALSVATSVGNFTLSDGATLTLNANLSSCGNITGGNPSHGTIAGNGILILNGTSSQSITGDIHLQEMQLNNTAGALMASGSTLHVATALDLTAGNFNATNGTLKFTSSSPALVGIIDNFTPGNTGTLTGTITAERYYNTSSTYEQHMIGSPVNTPAVSQFGASGTAGFVVPQADCDESQMYYTSPYGTLFSYHESSPGAATCGMAQWEVVTTGTATNGTGYSYRVAGSGTLDLTGTANLNTSYTVSGLTNSNWNNVSLQGRNMSSGWQLLSNPYLATLNLTTANSGFDTQIQVWNDSGSFVGTYQPGTVGSSAVVAPFQGFMVHKTNAGGSLSYVINATDRTRTVAQFFSQNENQLNIVAENTATGLLDQTTVAFNSSASGDFDPRLDADKLAGALNRHTVYTTNGSNTGRWLSINVLNSVATTGTVPLGFEPGISGNYAFNFNGLNTFDPTTYIMLEDKKLNVMYDVRSGAYSFTADAADNWNRFVLHFTPAIVISTSNANCNNPGLINIAQPGTSNWTYSVTNANLSILASGVLNQSSPISLSVQAGTYNLVLTDNNGYSVTKAIQVGGAQDVVAAFNTSSDNVSTQTGVQFNNASQNASSLLWNFGDGATSSSANTWHTYTAAGTYTVTLTAAGLGGCQATASQIIHVSGNAAGISNLTGNGNLNMWSNENRVYVDFTQLSNVNAIVKIYDILGREISNDKYTASALYQKEINNMDAAYVIVSVINEGTLETKKLFITNTK